MKVRATPVPFTPYFVPVLSKDIQDRVRSLQNSLQVLTAFDVFQSVPFALKQSDEYMDDCFILTINACTASEAFRIGLVPQCQLFWAQRRLVCWKTVSLLDLRLEFSLLFTAGFIHGVPYQHRKANLEFQELSEYVHLAGVKAAHFQFQWPTWNPPPNKDYMRLGKLPSKNAVVGTGVHEK